MTKHFESTASYFKSVDCIETLKAQYHALVMAWHPDHFQAPAEKANAEEEMKVINSQYTELFPRYKNIYKNQAGETYQTSHPTEEVPQDFIDIMRAVCWMKGVKVELCGRWVWVTGNTREYKESLKAAGFFWNFKKSAWSWHYPQDRVYSKGKRTLDDIRAIYGSKQYAAATELDAA